MSRRVPTQMEARCFKRLIELSERRQKLASLNANDYFAIIKAILHEARAPSAEMLSAMKSAMWKSGLQRGGQVTTTLKHQLRWAAGIDAACPPSQRAESDDEVMA